MNEVSIIINGVRYDAVSGNGCRDCDLLKLCDEISNRQPWLEVDEPLEIVCKYLNPNKQFKKSTKSFER